MTKESCRELKNKEYQTLLLNHSVIKKKSEDIYQHENPKNYGVENIYYTPIKKVDSYHSSLISSIVI